MLEAILDCREDGLPTGLGQLRSQWAPKVPSTATPCSESAREHTGEGQWPPTWHLLSGCLGQFQARVGSARHTGPELILPPIMSQSICAQPWRSRASHPGGKRSWAQACLPFPPLASSRGPARPTHAVPPCPSLIRLEPGSLSLGTVPPAPHLLQALHPFQAPSQCPHPQPSSRSQSSPSQFQVSTRGLFNNIHIWAPVHSAMTWSDQEVPEDRDRHLSLNAT